VCGLIVEDTTVTLEEGYLTVVVVMVTPSVSGDVVELNFLLLGRGNHNNYHLLSANLFSK
jgi:hypothetical protein